MHQLFQLHPTLAVDCFTVGDLPHCRVLLMNNASFPWLILVPRRAEMREIYDLSSAQYPEVMNEIRDVAEKFAQLTGAQKMNIATLGNMVPQLHIHVIARFHNDPAWPNPVWNSGLAAVAYQEKDRDFLLQRLRQSLQLAPAAD